VNSLAQKLLRSARRKRGALQGVNVLNCSHVVPASSATPHLLFLAAVEYGAAGGAEILPVNRHAGRDTPNVWDVLVAEAHGIRFAGGLLCGPLLRGGWQRRERERETEDCERRVTGRCIEVTARFLHCRFDGLSANFVLPSLSSYV
jgi:hypothetical protein